MGNKYFLHPSGLVAADGKIFCEYCKRELPDGNLKTDFPCTVSVKMPFDEAVEINVWNCHARLVINNEIFDLEKLSSREAGKLYRLMEESIYDVGGAINMSGIYPPSAKLCKYLTELSSSWEKILKLVKESG